jgi:hypothetical protein
MDLICGAVSSIWFKALTMEGAVTGLADPVTDKDLRDT